ncbi:MAG: ABC transporter permease, partial [Dehalococcoidia bacterium]
MRTSSSPTTTASQLRSLSHESRCRPQGRPRRTRHQHRHGPRRSRPRDHHRRALPLVQGQPGGRRQRRGAFAGLVGETGSFSTPEGFAYSQFFAFIPILLVVQAVISGSWAFAGEQGQGTMDLLLAQPITRRRLAIEKALSLTLALVLVALLAVPAFLVVMPFVDDFTISELRIVGATVMMLPVSLLFLWLSLWLSAIAPTRSAAATIATAAVVVTYFLHLVGASAESLHWMQQVSPFYWSDSSPALIGDFSWLRAIAVT